MRTTTLPILLTVAAGIAVLSPAAVQGQNYTGFSLAICQDGSVHSFGRNGIYQLGLGSNSPGSYDTQQTVPGIAGAVAVAIGYEHGLALLNDGTVLGWGSNAYGCAGQAYPTNAQVTTPTAIDLPGCAVAISAGVLHSMALLADGTVWTWGSDQYGQLGNDASASTTYGTPVQVSGITDATAIAAGGQSSYALLSTGKVKAWGYNGSGECGDASNTDRFTPVTVVTSSGELTLVTKIAGGGNHAVVLRSDGRIYTWGANGSGQLGRGTGNYTASNVAVHSSGMTNGAAVKIDIAAGSDCTIALKDNGQFRVCGSNNFNQLGTTTTGTYPAPFNGPTVSGLVDIMVPSTGRHGLGVKANGDLYAWGWNSWGQLGDATTTSQAPPVWINDPGNIDLTNTCPAKASSDNHPQPCCVAVQENERVQLNGTTISSSTTYTGQYISIAGTITINAPYSLTFNNCDVVMWPGAKIIVSAGTTTSNGATISITGGSHLYACDQMWDRIEVRNGARVYVQGSSIIEDAEVAVDMTDGCFFQIDQATFNRNYQHIKLTGPTTGPVFGSNYRVKRSHFGCQTTASLGGTAVYTNLLAPRQTQITSVAIQATGSRRCQVGASGNANTFNNSGWGIVAQTVKLVDVLYNTFNDMGQVGVHVFGGQVSSGNNTIDVKYNTLYKMPYGIFVYDNDTTARTHITNNTIDFAGMTSPPQYMTGITVSEITPATTYGTANFVDVSDNNIYSAPCGINLMNLQGDMHAPTAKLFVGRNTITHAKGQDDWQAGIKTDYVSQPAIIDNTISSVSGSTSWTETGIRISNGSEVSLYCNEMNNIGRAIWVDGDIRPNTHLFSNEMDNAQTGLLLNWGYVGQQGSSGSPRDNTWPGTGWSASDPHTLVLGTGVSGASSPFHVRSGYPYEPTYNSNGGGAFSVAVTTTSGSYTGGCVYTGASFKTGEDGTDAVSAALEMIGQPEAGSERNRSIGYMGRYNLYKSLLADATLALDNDELAAFFTESEAGNMGRLHRAMAAYAGAANDSVGAIDIEQVALELTDLVPANQVEATLQELLGLLVPNATDLTTLADDRAKRLREIATLCPLDFGFGVYIARAAVISVEGPKAYVNECEYGPVPEIKGRPNQGILLNTVTIYPNPNNGQFSVEYRLGEGASADLDVVDPLGRIVRSTRLGNNETTAAVDASDLSNGLYMVRLIIDGVVADTQQLTISR